MAERAAELESLRINRIRAGVRKCRAATTRDAQMTALHDTLRAADELLIHTEESFYLYWMAAWAAADEDEQQRAGAQKEANSL